VLIDLHADTPLWTHWLGYAFCRAHAAPLPGGMWLSNVDLPRMQAVGMDAQVFGLVSLPFEIDGYDTILTMIRRMGEAADASGGAFELVRTSRALAAARRRGARAGLLSIEGVHSLRGDMRRADALVDRGVVSFGLAHFHRNRACTPAQGLGANPTAGLTAFGRDLVAHLASRGVLLDLTHINRAGFFEALAHSTGRVLVSHTGLRGVHDIGRNIDDAQVRAIAERGGIIGVIFSRHFLGGNGIDAVVAHLEHLVRVGGAACAALGSDFDGFVVPVRGLRDIRGLPALREALRRRGLPAATVDGIMGDNAARFLAEAL
jgi:membrane dipeptidase